MNIPEWLKPAAAGAVVGALAVAIGGFSFAGWVGQSTAMQMATDRAEIEVTAAMVPICVQQAKVDPEFAASMARIKEGRSYERANIMMETTDWATMPGSDKAERNVASACIETLEAGT